LKHFVYVPIVLISIGLWNCSDNVVFLVFLVILILKTPPLFFSKISVERQTEMSWYYNKTSISKITQEPSRSWSYGSWIYNYLCNQWLSPLMFWVRINLGARCTALCDQVCQWLAAGRWFSPGTSVSSTNKTDLHDITEILFLKVALNIIKQTKH